MSTKSILLVEDDPAISKGLSDLLSSENYIIDVEPDGLNGYKKTAARRFDLIILDITLPGMNGIDICKKIREDKNTVPVLMLTSKRDEIDKVIGFEVGADDYVTKPFSIRELTARIKALLRRSDYIRADMEEFSFGSIKINFKTFEVFRNNSQVILSTTELKILKFFIKHPGEVVTRDKLLNEVWGYESFPTTRTVDNFILSLRKKIEEDPSEPRHFVTIPKAGYKFIL